MRSKSSKHLVVGYFSAFTSLGMLKGRLLRLGIKEIFSTTKENCLYPERHLSHEAFRVRDKSSLGLAWQVTINFLLYFIEKIGKGKGQATNLD